MFISYENTLKRQSLSDLNNPSFIVRVIYAVVFGLSFSLAFLEAQFFILAFVCLLPMLFAIENGSYKQVYVLGLIGGISACMSGTYWIYDFIVISKGVLDTTSLLLACMYWVYSAHLFVFVLLLYKWLNSNTKISPLYLFPLCMTTVSHFYPLLFEMPLANTQSNFLLVLQMIEFTGAIGLSFFIAFVNITLYSSLKAVICLKHKLPMERWITKQRLMLAWFLISIWFVLCFILFNYWQSQTNSWASMKVGVVQANEPVNLGQTPQFSGYSNAFPPELEMTKRLAELDLELIVWPESRYKRYFDSPAVQDAYHRVIKESETSVLLQDFENIEDQSGTHKLKQYNSVTLLNTDNENQLNQRYRKIKLIPFGEYLPVVDKTSLLGGMISSRLSGFLNELHSGEGFVSFKHKGLNIIPLICYETTFSSFVAKAVAASTYQNEMASTSSVLVAMSNDAWFGSSHQSFQHVLPSALRAVETRVSMLHAVNNGPSIVVNPLGERTQIGEFQKAGGYIGEIIYSEQSYVSFFVRYPHAVEYILSFSLVVFILFAVFGKKRKPL